MKKSLVFLILFFSFSSIFSQVGANERIERKNVIKWNPTPMLLLGSKNIVFGYERVIKNGQSFSLNIGSLVLPDIVNEAGDHIEFSVNNSKNGFVAAADYRFYFKNRNKFSPPDGLYWGPYASIINLGYAGESNFYENGVARSVGLDIDGYIYSLGAQIGYQLLINNRFGIDFFILAPSWSRFTIEADIHHESELNEDAFFDNMEEKLSNQIPFLNSILEEDLNLDADGKLSFNDFFIRFGVQLSFAF